MNPIWVLVNCTNFQEAKEIGDIILEKRLASCYDIILRELSTYFWPPKSGKRESGKGSLLILETLDSKYLEIRELVKKLHSDELPFIGFIKIEGTENSYREWIEGELT